MCDGYFNYSLLLLGEINF